MNARAISSIKTKLRQWNTRAKKNLSSMASAQ
jgi:hypothetical protein